MTWGGDEAPAETADTTPAEAVPKKYDRMRYGERVGRRSKVQTNIGAFTTGVRVVKENCDDISKKEAYYARYKRARKLNTIHPFMPNHDFGRDYTYIELSRPLNYFDIEACKWMASGNDVKFTARALMGESKACRNLLPGWRRLIYKREASYKKLIEHFRVLLGHQLDPGSYTVDEAMRSLVSDIRAAKAGKERSDLTYRLIDMLGLQKELKQAGSRLVIGNSASPSGGASAAQAMALAGMENTNGPQAEAD